MRYALCHCCEYFVEEIKTLEERHPNYCSHPELSEFCGLEAGGFISGTDIFYCDCFSFYSYNCGDVVFTSKKGGKLAYVIPKERKERKIFRLTDNSKNIEQISYLEEHPKRHAKRRKNEQTSLEKSNSGSDSDSLGSTGSDFREYDIVPF